MSIPVVGNTPFMIFGADVTHPTSFNEADPSIAAVCASVDRSLGRFMSRVLKQVCGGGWGCNARRVAARPGCCREWLGLSVGRGAVLCKRPGRPPRGAML